LEDGELEALAVPSASPLDLVFEVVAGLLENGLFSVLQDLVDVFLLVKECQHVSGILSAVAHDEGVGGLGDVPERQEEHLQERTHYWQDQHHSPEYLGLLWRHQV